MRGGRSRAGATGYRRNGAREEAVVVEGEELDTGVEGFGGDFCIAEAACFELQVSQAQMGPRNGVEAKENE